MQLFFPVVLLSLFFMFGANTHPAKEGDEFNLMFYNLENLFDTYDDPQTDDDEFLPDGDRHWTPRKFHQKINKIGKVILSSCEFSVPDIVGVCEIENRGVLEKLLEETPLAEYDYQLIHKDSPDPRGIDVALLYRTDNCRPLTFEYIPMRDASGSIIRSREILYASFQLSLKDTLHVFFNHWPSRYGGQSQTDRKRVRAANILRQKIDKLFQAYQSPKIIIMGDFNDEPRNKSMSENLKALPQNNPLSPGELINLSANWKRKGTLKHQQSWVVFDQILVSDYLLDSNHCWQTGLANAQILDFDFLLENDPKYKGKRLNRTFDGFKYHGGFSDHLPVRLQLVYKD